MSAPTGTTLKVWVASSADIDGLATEAATLEELRDKVLVMVAELAELNGLSSDLPEIPVHILQGKRLASQTRTSADAFL